MQMESVVAQDFAYSKEGLEKEFDESMLEPLKEMDLSNIKPSKVAQESRDLDRILASMKDENAQLKSEVGLMSSKDAEKHYDPADEIGYLRDQQANLLSGLKKQEGKVSKMFNKMAKTNVGLPKDTETAVGSFEFDEDAVSAKDKNKEGKKDDKKEGKKKEKEEKPWYERDNWHESDECQNIAMMGEPTLIYQSRYVDVGYVCGKDLLAVACDAKTGMNVDFVFVESLGVVQAGFSGNMRSDAQKQENSVVRSMRITQICNVEDKMTKSKNRCELEESTWIKGEPMVGKTVNERRYKIHYQCNYGKRAETKKNYVPTISPPTKPKKEVETTEDAKEEEENEDQETTEEADEANEAAEELKKKSEEAKKAEEELKKKAEEVKKAEEEAKKKAEEVKRAEEEARQAEEKKRRKRPRR